MLLSLNPPIFTTLTLSTLCSTRCHPLSTISRLKITDHSVRYASPVFGNNFQIHFPHLRITFFLCYIWHVISFYIVLYFFSLTSLVLIHFFMHLSVHLIHPHDTHHPLLPPGLPSWIIKLDQTHHAHRFISSLTFCLVPCDRVTISTNF